MTELLFKKLSFDVVGAAMEVYNRLGPFFTEPTYQRAMEIELRFRGIPFLAKQPVQIPYRDYVVASGEVDLLVDDSIIVELKSASAIHPNHVSQTLTYLAACERSLGLVLNFGNIDKLQIKRIPFSGSLEILRSRRPEAASGSS